MVQRVAFLFHHQERVEFIRPNLVETNLDAELQRSAQVECAADQEAGFARLRGLEFVERAMVAAVAVLRCVRTQPWIAEFLAPQGPVDQEAEGGPLRPLPIQKFGSRSSWKAASSASIAAFTARAWWMIGTSPA